MGATLSQILTSLPPLAAWPGQSSSMTSHLENTWAKHQWCTRSIACLGSLVRNSMAGRKVQVGLRIKIFRKEQHVALEFVKVGNNAKVREFLIKLDNLHPVESLTQWIVALILFEATRSNPDPDDLKSNNGVFIPPPVLQIPSPTNALCLYLYWIPISLLSNLSLSLQPLSCLANDVNSGNPLCSALQPRHLAYFNFNKFVFWACSPCLILSKTIALCVQCPGKSRSQPTKAIKHGFGRCKPSLGWSWSWRIGWRRTV